MQIESIYSPSDINNMQIADNAHLRGGDRVEDIRNFAKLANYKRIGIANCVSLQHETNLLKTSLSSDFEVFTVDCKCGRIPNSEIIGFDAKGISCNPAGQAHFLAENNTELNMVMGLCVGHDMIFSAKSKAPSTTLIVKDLKHKYNPMEIFRSEGQDR